MGHAASSSSSTSEVPPNNVDVAISNPPSPDIIQDSKRCQSSAFRKQRQRRFKKILKSLAFSCCRNGQKIRKHAKISKSYKRESFFDSRPSSFDICPNVPPELQLYWLQNKQSLLSYALSKLAFFSRMSKDKLKEDERKNGKILKVYHDQDKNVTETLRRISISDLNGNPELRTKLINKILSRHSSHFNPSANPDDGGNLRKIRSPEEIYKRNLKKFERLLAITASTSSSATSYVSVGVGSIIKVNVNANNNAEKIADKNNNTAAGVDENQNLLGKTDGNLGSKRKSCLVTQRKHPPKRIISTSKNRVEVDVQFLDWIKSKMGSQTQKATVVEKATTVKPSSSSSSSSSPPSTKKAPAKKDTNNNGKRGNLKFLKRGGGTGGNSVSAKSKSSGNGKTSTSTSTRSRTTTSTSTSTKTKTATTTTKKSQKRSSDKRRCQNCGPCAGKGALSAAPPAYLDYGACGAANAAGSAWKGKRKGDPVMDRLKNVDVVEEMTYLVPTPDCGGNGDACGEMAGAEEDDDCEYYAVCESCGEMEPIPEELKQELKGRKKRKGKAESTPVTYSRRQRFNFKNKGDMCDEDDGPPYLYEGLQCPGPGCRCSCCVSGLRRNADCNCKCCQTMGPARKCSSFDEFPVGKNPVIRRILCPEEECAKRREACKKLMPDNSGMYRFDINNKIFERQVPRTPTPIMVEVEAPQPLTKQQLLAVGREIQEKKRLGIEMNSCCRPCPPLEQDPMYLPPIYGQCNPPQCQPCCPQPCQPCCQPCCPPQCQGADQSGSYRSGSSYYYDDSQYSYTATTTSGANYPTTDPKSTDGAKSKLPTYDSNNNTIADLSLENPAVQSLEPGSDSSGSLPTE